MSLARKLAPQAKACTASACLEPSRPCSATEKHPPASRLRSSSPRSAAATKFSSCSSQRHRRCPASSISSRWLSRPFRQFIGSAFPPSAFAAAAFLCYPAWVGSQQGRASDCLLRLPPLVASCAPLSLGMPRAQIAGAQIVGDSDAACMHPQAPFSERGLVDITLVLKAIACNPGHHPALLQQFLGADGPKKLLNLLGTGGERRRARDRAPAPTDRAPAPMDGSPAQHPARPV